MIVLALTTSTDRGSLALARSGRIIATKAWTRTAQHSETLTPQIAALLKKSKLTPEQIDVIAVDRGPGSFTGCRIAVNVAKTLAFSLEKPVFAPYSLDLMARELAVNSRAKHLICLLDAHKSLYYFGSYAVDKEGMTQRKEKIVALSIQDISSQIGPQTAVVGNFSRDVSELLRKQKAKLSKSLSLNYPQAKTLALWASQTQAPGLFENWTRVEPAYIRSPDVVEKLSAFRDT